VLILAAFAPEIAALRKLFGERLRGQVAELEVVCAVVGVGLPNASAATTAQVIEHRPRAVVLIGTAGVYPPHVHAIGEGVVIDRVLLVDPVEIEARAAIPAPMARSIDCHPDIASSLASGGPTAALSNPLSVTTDDGLARLLAAADGGALESLEAFGVANACALQGVSFGCVVGVSNRVGKNGRAEWRANHESAARAACEIVIRWLGNGAQGIPRA
jgi:nucleoside phosphorylase